MTTGWLTSSGQATIAGSTGGNPGAVTVGGGGGRSVGSDGVTINAGNGAGGTSSTTGAAAVAAGGFGGVGGSAATDAASADSGGAAGAPMDPYAPRSGAFKVLVYSRTGSAAFRHQGAISSGKIMLEEIAATQGFELAFAEDNELITATGLADYELVFFLHTSGDVFGAAEEQAFEEWIKQGGAFVGMHSAADTEYEWAFYKELTGQYYEGHGAIDVPGTIVWQAGAQDHPAIAGLPDPWPRVDEWMRFSRESEWASKPGFKILGRLEADNLPVIWCREHDNYRAFYTALGHLGTTLEEPEVTQHVTGAIMWAVRREHLL